MATASHVDLIYWNGPKHLRKVSVQAVDTSGRVIHPGNEYGHVERFEPNAFTIEECKQLADRWAQFFNVEVRVNRW